MFIEKEIWNVWSLIQVLREISNIFCENLYSECDNVVGNKIPNWTDLFYV